MAEIARELLHVNLEEEMRRSYLDYAMSVIVGRALPDVRDGLKPVHRRVLFAMHELGNDWNRPYKKSRPHRRRRDRQVPPARRHRGLRHHGAHGAGLLAALPAGRRPGQLRLGRRRQRGGDALHRVPLPRSPHELLADIDKETVDFSPTTTARSASRGAAGAFPNLLVNGSSGIAVGMATNIPPHNLGEVVDACLALLDNPEIDDRRADGARPGAGLPDRRHHLRPRRRARGLPHRPRPRGDARQDALRGHRQGRRAGDHRRRAALPGEQGALLERIAELVARRSSRASPTSATSPTSPACAW
jgi:DNA gyrase subunit A